MHRKRISRLHSSILHISMCHQKWDFYGGPTFRKYPPQKIAAPSRKFLGENPMKGGLDSMSIAWMSFNLPNFFPGGPISETRLSHPKGNGNPKNPLNNPSNPSGGVSPTSPQKNSSIAKLKNSWLPPFSSRWTWNSLGPLRCWRKWRGSASGLEGAKRMKANWIGPGGQSNFSHPKNAGLFLIGPNVENVGNLGGLGYPKKKHLGNLRCWSSTIWCSKTGWSHSQSWGAHMIL